MLQAALRGAKRPGETEPQEDENGKPKKPKKARGKGKPKANPKAAPKGSGGSAAEPKSGDQEIETKEGEQAEPSSKPDLSAMWSQKD